jgi:sulfide:quinone oxidoreductase
MHDLLTERGSRDRSSISLVMPLPSPVPPSPDASKALLAAFAERGIEFHPQRLVRGLDPSRQVALIGDDEEMPYDLFLAVPKHRAPDVVLQSGLAVDGWIPVDPLTLETSFPDVYAVGDVTSVGTPKAGVFAEGQASVVADRLIARARGDTAAAEYGGMGICYLEVGQGSVAKVEVTFMSGHAPTGGLQGPSTAFVEDKRAFGTTRVQRWFGREWPAVAPSAP